MNEGRRKRLGGQFDSGATCAHPGCTEPGEYRAPVAPPGQRAAPAGVPPQWQYLCLEHVRDFNAKWNWFEGLSAEEIRAAQSPFASWEREARAFARNADPRRPAAAPADPLDILGWRTGERSPRPARLSAADERALRTLGLGHDATLADVKARYRELARRYHPDANRGDRRHEARLAAVTEAHAHLRRSLRRHAP